MTPPVHHNSPFPSCLPLLAHPPNQPLIHSSARRAFERLIRKLLLLPQRPAVVLVNAYNYFFDNPRQGAYWSNVETDFTTFAQYYNLVSLSVRGCCYDAMVANTTGFQVSMNGGQQQW